MLKIKEGFSGERAIVLPRMMIEMQQQDPLVSSLYITDIGYYPLALHHYRERREGIGEYVLIYCVDGEGWAEVAGKRLEIHRNQYLILPASVPHAYGSNEQYPWTIYWVHFNGSHAALYADDVVAPHEISPTMNSRIQERNNIFEELFEALLQGGYQLASLRYVSSLLHFYLATIRYVEQFRDLTQSKGNATVVQASIHYMQENLGRKLVMQEVAAYVGYSVSRFSHLFREATGHSPMDYYLILKMQYACQLLTTTDMLVSQISHKLGISDSLYFSRLFSKHMGVSPRVYREQHSVC